GQQAYACVHVPSEDEDRALGFHERARERTEVVRAIDQERDATCVCDAPAVAALLGNAAEGVRLHASGGRTLACKRAAHHTERTTARPPGLAYAAIRTGLVCAIAKPPSHVTRIKPQGVTAETPSAFTRDTSARASAAARAGVSPSASRRTERRAVPSRSIASPIPVVTHAPSGASAQKPAPAM